MKNSGWIKKALVPAAVLAVVLTGCAGGSDDAAGGGEGNASGGEGGKSLVVGASMPLSGPVGATGSANLCGLEAYFAAANAAGDFGDYEVIVTSKDNQFDPSAAATIAREFAADQVSAVFITGTLIADASRQVLEGSKIPTFVVGDGAAVTPPKWPGEYGFQPSYVEELRAGVSFLKDELGETKISMVNSAGAGGQGLSDTWPSLASELGFEAGAQPRIPNDAQDFSGFAQQLKDGGATAVFVSTPETIFANLQKAADAIGYHPVWAVTGYGFGPTYREAVGDLANGVYVTQWTKPISDTTDESVKTYLSEVEEFGDDCDASAPNVAVGYNLAAIIGLAIEEAVKNGEPSFDAIQTALAAVDGEQIAMTPGVAFTEDSHAAVSSVSFWEVTSDGLTQASTDWIPLGK